MKLIIRKSLYPDREPAWFHDYYKFLDGTWQIGFFIRLIYTRKK